MRALSSSSVFGGRPRAPARLTVRLSSIDGDLHLLLLFVPVVELVKEFVASLGFGCGSAFSSFVLEGAVPLFKVGRGVNAERGVVIAVVLPPTILNWRVAV